jgi:hypothetical protein
MTTTDESTGGIATGETESLRMRFHTDVTLGQHSGKGSLELTNSDVVTGFKFS